MKLTGRYVILIPFILYISGCAVGRSWDSPNISGEQVSIDVDSSIEIYTRGNISLIRSALINNKTQRYYPFAIRDINSYEDDMYPLFVVSREDPKYPDGFLKYLMRLSFFTYSIVPGYWYESSNITLTLKLKNSEGDVITKSKTFVAKRHLLNWLLLLPFANYGFTVMAEWGASNTDDYWYKAYKYYIREFIVEEMDLILEYK